MKVLLADSAVTLLAQAASTFPVILKDTLMFNGISLSLLLGLFEWKGFNKHVFG